ncbi:MAG: conjugal transfer protein TraG, partial [Hydrogenophaga sp.]
IKFWSVLWFIVVWLDRRLIDAMYPGGTWRLTDLFSSAELGYKRMLLNVLMMTLFIGLPLLWTGMMAWIGLNVNAALTNVLGGASQTATNATSRSTPSMPRGGRR